MARPVIAPFRARARLLALLGDQLIGSDQLAVFELVKNAYDADAAKVKVTLNGVDGDDPTIEVVDDGEGMTLATIRDIWLEPASDHREVQRNEKHRTRRFRRLPLGEKGVGRFAVHKLGRRIDLITRPRGEKVEYLVTLDWDALTAVRYLDQTRVRIRSRPAAFFTRAKGRALFGTCILISNLRRAHWRRGEARQLQRSITAISSPFKTNDKFSADLEIPEHPEWLEGLPDVDALIGLAPWRFDFTVDASGRLTWDYKFTSPMPKRVEGRHVAEKADKLLLDRPPGQRASPVADKAAMAGIGPLKGQLIAYDRDRKILAMLPQSQTVRDFLDQQGGVRVYRDGVRVYNYGEPGDDWLQLDMRRVNRPAQRLSRNIVIAAINLDLERSTGLREKTNREGFDENEVFGRFKSVVTGVIHKFEVERNSDKERLKRILDDTAEREIVLVETPLRLLRDAVLTSPDRQRLLPLVERVDSEFQEMRDLLLRAGMQGLNLAVVIHEVEKGIREVYEAVRSKASPEILEARSRNLMSLIESIGGLLREKAKDGADLRELVHGMAEINIRRFRRHQVRVTYDLPGDEREPLRVAGSSALLQNVLVNLVDNAIYWLRVRWPDQREGAPLVRRIHVAYTEDLPGGPALVIADNGPGFEDQPEVLTKPFFTRRPDGIGLGLYYASLAMALANGALLFPDRDELELPEGLNGAVVAMQFGKRP